MVDLRMVDALEFFGAQDLGEEPFLQSDVACFELHAFEPTRWHHRRPRRLAHRVSRPIGLAFRIGIGSNGRFKSGQHSRGHEHDP
jgi:hypothetical protein